MVTILLQQMQSYIGENIDDYLSIDVIGNVYFSDNHRIRKIDFLTSL
jgi:hypothetical protein